MGVTCTAPETVILRQSGLALAGNVTFCGGGGEVVEVVEVVSTSGISCGLAHA